MSGYSTFIDGEWTHVYDLEECLNSIRCRNLDNERKIKNLKEANKKLKEDNYKDNELSKMQFELDKMRQDYWRGFPITEDEEKVIEEWKKKHVAEKHRLKTEDDILRAGGSIGGTWKFEFIPTSIGISGSIVCGICGEKFEFQKIR